MANISFEMRIFPNRMKIAKVIPIYKSGLKDSFTNYRPVSLFLQFSKILAKHFINRLNTFLEINNNQIVNMVSEITKTASHALIDLHEPLPKLIDNNWCVYRYKKKLAMPLIIHCCFKNCIDMGLEV